ncbi:hypothetical protein X777_02720 [Ooceraea biroi]|uniref:Uncharacterized protein n=1 Tax=Ooceraea biroi TaxID=2015173 RepID=A0A026WP41_OOCBI|nr:hypothetical protein X777_02720 [Ooceraea biroi]
MKIVPLLARSAEKVDASGDGVATRNPPQSGKKYTATHRFRRYPARDAHHLIDKRSVKSLHRKSHARCSWRRDARDVPSFSTLLFFKPESRRARLADGL